MTRATTLSETETPPATITAPAPYYLDPSPTGEEPAWDEQAIWQVIERWVTVRWVARPVVYIAEGPGEWLPRLTPFTLGTTEQWDGSAWAAVTLAASPLGGLALDAVGPYRITGTAGDDSPPPAVVNEAWRRLREFHDGVAWESFRAGTAQAGEDTPRAWAAKALQLSGAADLLRPYRRLAR